MQNDDEAWLSISLVGHGELVKNAHKLITVEPHGMFSFCFLVHFKVVFRISNKVK